MLKKIPLRLRLTLLSILLLTICCTGLTVILNLSANHMADVIEAVPIVPAKEFPPDVNSEETGAFPGGMLAVLPAERSQTARIRFLHQSILYMTLIVLSGGALTYYLSGRALRPLQELGAQMKNRTVHNLSEALPVPESHDEIADLTVSFNIMSAKLDEAFAMRKRFSQSAAHELRTPLTVMKTKMEVFQKKREHTEEEYGSLLSVLNAHINRLSDLVKDLLNLTNMEELACDESVELSPMLREIAGELSGLAKEKNITVTVCGEALTVNGNQRLLHRAFYNLVENSVKYNTQNGNVEISVAAAAGRCVVTIADTGIGIPAELRELIFEPFFRVDKSRSRQMGGSGLGLPMVRSILEQHHARIIVSENPDGGTIFEIML